MGWFGPSEVWSAGLPVQRNALRLARATGGYTLGFGGFLACYNGVFCFSERTFGRESLASPVASGGVVGLAVGTFITPLRVATILSTSGMCAGMCGLCHVLGVGGWRA